MQSPITKKRIPTQAEMEEDLLRLEIGIRHLRIQYETFFAGGLKREPVLLRANVSKIIKRYNEVAIPKVALRFKFSSLVSRYNIFCELWGKRLRDMEEGVRRTPVRVHETGERLVATCRLAEPSADDASLRDLHQRFNTARRATGQGEREVTFERFLRGVATQTRQLREKSGCEQVELRLVVDGENVQIRARPGR